MRGLTPETDPGDAIYTDQFQQEREARVFEVGG